MQLPRICTYSLGSQTWILFVKTYPGYLFVGSGAKNLSKISLPARNHPFLVESVLNSRLGNFVLEERSWMGPNTLAYTIRYE
jgi:hypothetical protein